MPERLNTMLDDGVKQMLVELAGGERKVGVYLSALIRAAYTKQIVSKDELGVLVERMNKLERDTATVLTVLKILQNEEITTRDTGVSEAEAVQWLLQQMQQPEDAGEQDTEGDAK